MTEFFEKYGGVLISLVAGLASVMMVFMVFNTSPTSTGGSVMKVVDVGLAEDTTSKDVHVDYDTAKVEFEVKNGIIDRYSKFNWKNYVTVKIDGEAKESYKNYVSPLGTVDTSSLGSHKLKLQLNWHGVSETKTIEIYVRNI